MGFVYSPQAEQDLLDIWCYIAGANIAAADHYLSMIDDTCHLLASNPKMGRSRPEISPDARAFFSDSHLILYRSTDTGISVIRIIHHARDINSLQ